MHNKVQLSVRQMDYTVKVIFVTSQYLNQECSHEGWQEYV